MFRYENEGTTISVMLPNGYKVWVMARWQRESMNYTLKMFIQNKQGQLDLLDVVDLDDALITYDSDVKNIKADMTRLVTDLYYDGFFNSFIERYKFTIECLNKGSEIIIDGINEENENV